MKNQSEFLSKGTVIVLTTEKNDRVIGCLENGTLVPRVERKKVVFWNKRRGPGAYLFHKGELIHNRKAVTLYSRAFEHFGEKELVEVSAAYKKFEAGEIKESTLDRNVHAACCALAKQNLPKKVHEAILETFRIMNAESTVPKKMQIQLGSYMARKVCKLNGSRMFV